VPDKEAGPGKRGKKVVDKNVIDLHLNRVMLWIVVNGGKLLNGIGATVMMIL